MIETGQDLREARERLGLKVVELGRALRLSGSPSHVIARVRAMEAGNTPVTGPVQIAVEAMLAGYWPEGFDIPS